jgi:quercetin dioxygenase-like cupin family protein
MMVNSASFRQVRPDPARAEPLSMDGVKGTRMEMLVGRAHGAPSFSMRHFVVEPGGHTPHHQHDYEHEVVILEGEADVLFDSATHRARAGDVLFIPANHMHQFRNAGQEAMRFLCMVPTTFDCGKPTPGS